MHKLLAGAGGATVGAAVYWWLHGVRLGLPPHLGVAPIWGELAGVAVAAAIRSRAKGETGKIFAECVGAVPAALLVMRVMK